MNSFNGNVTELNYNLNCLNGRAIRIKTLAHQLD